MAIWFINWGILFGIVMYLKPLFVKSSMELESMTANVGVQPNIGEVYQVTPQLQPLYAGVVGGLPTHTPQPTYTALPTYTPFPTPTFGSAFTYLTPTVTKVPFEPSQVNWVFSYYNPWLCVEDYSKWGANCHVDNLVMDAKSGNIVDVVDTTACEVGWKDKFMYEMEASSNGRYKGSIAVPYYPDTTNPIYPCGASVHVESPSIMAGDYLVTDYCPACDDYVASHNVLFIDFLAKGLPEGVTFWDKVVVSQVLYPWEVR